MKLKVTSYSSEASLINAIIFFIIGAILYSNSDAVLSFVSIAIGIILVVIGIIQIIFYNMERKTEEGGKKVHVVSAATSLLIAIIFIFFHNIVEQFIRFIIGAWILFSGIKRFISSFAITNTKKFLPLLIVSILLMIVGIYTIITPNVFINILGIIMMIYAVIEVIGYIFYTKDTMQAEETGSTTLIVKDNTEEVVKNEKKVKTVKNVKEKKAKTTKSKKKNDKKED